MTTRGALRALTIAAGVALIFAQPARAATPTETLRAFFERANAIVRAADVEQGMEEPRRAVRALVSEVFDLREAAATALGPAWEARTPAERDEFTGLFAEFLERGYISALGSTARVAGGLTIRYLSETVDGDAATVTTTLLTRGGADLPIEYQMVRRDDHWMVRDVVIDGVSLAANYRAQFRRILRDASYPELVARMREEAPEAPVRVAAAVAPVPPARVEPPARRPAPAVASDAPAPGLGRDVWLAALRVEEPPPATGQPAPPAPHAAPAPVVEAPRPQPAAPAATVTSYWVQVGAFRTVDAAIHLVERLRRQAVTISSSAVPGVGGRPAGVLARVLVGPFPDRAQAASKLRELLARGYEVFIAERRE
jgi:phospholipid transport system substrate-binding protein